MVGTMAPRHYCGVCDASFTSKADLREHTANHPDTKSPQHICGVCHRKFDDTLALENHQRSNGHWSAVHVTTLTSIRNAEPSTESLPSPITSTLSGSGDIYCDICMESFKSQASFNRHKLRCVAKSGVLPQTEVLPKKKKKPKKKASFQKQKQEAGRSVHQKEPNYSFNGPPRTDVGPLAVQSTTSAPAPPQNLTTPATLTAPPSSASQPKQFTCAINGCGKAFASKPAFEVHQMDAHATGNAIFTSSMRQKLQGEGLLRSHPSAASRRARQQNVQHPHQPHAVPPVPPVPPPAPALIGRPPPGLTFPPSMQPVAPGPLQSAPGPAEEEQAFEVTEKVARLMIPVHICFEKDGTFTCGGQSWLRITIDRQPSFMQMLDNLVHLRKLPPDEQAKCHVLPATAFADSGHIEYPSEDFKLSPASNPSALGAIAIVCSKILLTNGQYDVVKIAAIDILSCRILLNHLVCSNPKASVKDWDTSKTGLNRFELLEHAREAGYKVLKGWKAARTVLYKFIDTSTIIVGQDLRRDLDALRMIHGRAIDIAKMVEKAAEGPLSRQQLSIPSISSTFMGIKLKSDPMFGQDVLQHVFAVRGMAMWSIRHGEELVKKAKAVSLDYQRSGGA